MGGALYDDQPFLSNVNLSSLRDASQEESDGDPYTQPSYNFQMNTVCFMQTVGAGPISLV
jgi:hypothetical protein